MLARMSYLERWNAMPVSEAAEAVLACCGSRAWALGVAARRPLGTLPELMAASDSAWWALAKTDWDEAFASHPRIGERHAAGAALPASLRWSDTEQRSAQNDVQAAETKLLEAGNRAYEERFGRVFLVRAAGRNAAEILKILERRLRNKPEVELQEAAEQQREITHGRLQRWLAERETEAANVSDEVRA